METNNTYNILNLTGRNITLFILTKKNEIIKKIDFLKSESSIQLIKNNNIIIDSINTPAQDNNNTLQNISIPIIVKNSVKKPEYTIKTTFDFNNIYENTILLVNHFVAKEIYNNNVEVNLNVDFILSIGGSGYHVFDKKNKIIGTTKFIKWNLNQNQNQNQNQNNGWFYRWFYRWF
jgi:hypothetical protein